MRKTALGDWLLVLLVCAATASVYAQPRPARFLAKEDILLYGLGLKVEIETLPDLGAIIIRGRKRDVEELKRIIQEIERLSVETEPEIELYQLRHVGGPAIADIITLVNSIPTDVSERSHSCWAVTGARFVGVDRGLSGLAALAGIPHSPRLPS